ncbi:cyclic nucleotide-binding domain-containing protein [Mitsuaria sp. GD03876]|uniref:cyclic nucleotide-binding domain-containing protein n=1 Tax=Mitsuaria sp. GD03876 TaxID=2975399 RepID=UPI00244C8EE9|nr:cyclic nucleotide-binding domain-containing protein [Mitsuaria sp. GD03876]MDH0866310.1 cyclic nucleotide-binding domain-containing protein [Mitsuaria sp. GD03876]
MSRPLQPAPIAPPQDAFKVACSTCALRQVCLPTGLPVADVEQLERMVSERRAVPRNTVLFKAGEAFEAIYIVRTGFFKTSAIAEDGREQVTGFHMAAEMLGLDGIFSGAHASQAVALEDSQICVVPYGRLEDVTREVDRVRRQFHRLMSRELVRDQGVMTMLGAMRAEKRVAVFLINLMRKLRARGFSSSSVVLRMTRDEIGSHLGLTLETVSRTFSRMQGDGLLEVRAREVRVLKPRQLLQLARRAA